MSVCCVLTNNWHVYLYTDFVRRHRWAPLVATFGNLYLYFKECYATCLLYNPPLLTSTVTSGGSHELRGCSRLGSSTHHWLSHCFSRWHGYLDSHLSCIFLNEAWSCLPFGAGVTTHWNHTHATACNLEEISPWSRISLSLWWTGTLILKRKCYHRQIINEKQQTQIHNKHKKNTNSLVQIAILLVSKSPRLSYHKIDAIFHATRQSCSTAVFGKLSYLNIPQSRSSVLLYNCLNH